MGGEYFGFVAAAYGFSALALVGLGVWVFLDGRRVKRRLGAIEAGAGRRRSEGTRL